MCQKDTPVVNRLYNLIQEDPELAKDIKLIGIACTNTQDLVDGYKTHYRISYPVFPDEKGDVYLAVGVSGTTTMVVTTPGGKVLMSRRGGIEDFDKLVKELRNIHKKL